MFHLLFTSNIRLVIASCVYDFYLFFFLFTGLLLVPYGLIYSARIVCIEHCLDVNHVCISVCEELNDDVDDDFSHSLRDVSLKVTRYVGLSHQVCSRPITPQLPISGG